MALLDFLTQPRLKVTRGDQMNVTPYAPAEQPAPDGLLSSAVEPMQMGAPEQMMQAPDIEQKPSLLQGAWDWIKSPQGRLMIGAGLKSLGGDENAGYEAAQIGARMRDERRALEKEAQAKDDLARKNAAFKAAYQDGRFNPQAYLDAIGDEGDASEAFSLAKALAPQGGVSGDTSYTRDPITGEVTWGEERPWSRRDQEAADKADEMAAYREILAEVAKGRLGVSEAQAALARQREGRIAAGGGKSGAAKAGVPAPPSGFRIITPGG